MLNDAKEFMKKNYLTIVIVAVIASTLALAVAPGCSGAGMSKAEVDHYKTIISETKSRAEKVKEEAVFAIQEAEKAGNSDGVKEATAQLDAAAKVIVTANNAEAFLIKASSPSGDIGFDGAITAAGGFLPPPWNAAALILAPIAAWGLKELQRRRDIRSMIDGIEAAKQADAEFKGALIRNKGRLLEHYNDNVFKEIEARVGSK